MSRNCCLPDARCSASIEQPNLDIATIFIGGSFFLSTKDQELDWRLLPLFSLPADHSAASSDALWQLPIRASGLYCTVVSRSSLRLLSLRAQSIKIWSSQRSFTSSASWQSMDAPSHAVKGLSRWLPNGLLPRTVCHDYKSGSTKNFHPVTCDGVLPSGSSPSYSWVAVWTTQILNLPPCYIFFAWFQDHFNSPSIWRTITAAASRDKRISSVHRLDFFSTGNWNCVSSFVTPNHLCFFCPESLLVVYGVAIDTDALHGTVSMLKRFPCTFHISFGAAVKDPGWNMHRQDLSYAPPLFNAWKYRGLVQVFMKKAGPSGWVPFATGHFFFSPLHIYLWQESRYDTSHIFIKFPSFMSLAILFS